MTTLKGFYTFHFLNHNQRNKSVWVTQTLWGLSLYQESSGGEQPALGLRSDFNKVKRCHGREEAFHPGHVPVR